MDVVTIILKAAKAAHVSGTLLLAICSHESQGFTKNYNPDDMGTPSHGVCQVKYGTALLLGFKGKAEDLNNPKINAKYAALYLKFQQKRYGDNWVKLTAAYNAGKYRASNIVLGCPRNLKYVKLVQTKLSEEHRDKLNCGPEEISENL